MNTSISCAISDYFEAACVLKYQLAITMNTGISYHGIATNIVYNQNKVECLQLLQAEQFFLLPLGDITDAVVMTAGARFSKIPIKSCN